MRKLNQNLSLRKYKLGCGLVLVCSLALPSYSWADKIRKIVHPDGRVEYTNIPDKQRSVHFTNKEKHSLKQVYKYRNAEGVVSFSDEKPVNLSYETLRFDCFACAVSSPVNWHNTPLNQTAYRAATKQAAQNYAVDEALIRAVIHAESAFKVDAVSRVGAQGLMQLMPATADELGVKNAFAAEQNIAGGAKYLALLLQSFSGDTRLATAAYNAGPGAVKRYQGIPPYAETQAYVERVAILHQRYAEAL